MRRASVLTLLLLSTVVVLLLWCIPIFEIGYAAVVDHVYLWGPDSDGYRSSSSNVCMHAQRAFLALVFVTSVGAVASRRRSSQFAVGALVAGCGAILASLVQAAVISTRYVDIIPVLEGILLGTVWIALLAGAARIALGGR